VSNGRFAGKVALVTGAARGQGRSHAHRLATEGADVIAVDICSDIPSVPYGQATPGQLIETAELVRAAGRRAAAFQADVRDIGALQAAVSEATADLGRIDVVIANAGIIQLKGALEITAQDWRDVIDVNLTGSWNTISVCLPYLLAQESSSVVITSSAAGVKGPPNMAHYAASKSGLLGLMRSLASELGPRGVRVNAVLPTTVNTDMVHWPASYKIFRPDLDAPTRADVEPVFASLNVLPVPWIEPADVTSAVCWLASDDARYVTGVALPVDAGTVIK
jgi:(+)-trans-carveol dehydrogenase